MEEYINGARGLIRNGTTHHSIIHI